MRLDRILHGINIHQLAVSGATTAQVSLVFWHFSGLLHVAASWSGAILENYDYFKKKLTRS